MAFGFAEAKSGDFLPIVKFDSKDGRVSKVDRVEGAQGWEKNETDITSEFSAIMDMENIQVGWMHFGPNGPVRAMSTYLKEPTPDRPADKGEDGRPLFKQGFTVIMALSKSAGGGIYEMSGTAKGLVDAMGAIHDAYMEDGEHRPEGKLPIVSLVSTRKEETKYGKFYRPVFEIQGWAARPESLQPKAVAKPAVASNGNGFAKSSAPTTGSTVKAPPPKPAARVEASVGDFG